MSPSPPPAPVSNDIRSLFARFGQAEDAPRYLETVRDAAAQQALLRWPLLAEVQGAAQ